MKTRKVVEEDIVVGAVFYYSDSKLKHIVSLIENKQVIFGVYDHNDIFINFINDIFENIIGICEIEVKEPKTITFQAYSVYGTLRYENIDEPVDEDWIKLDDTKTFEVIEWAHHI